MPARRKPTDEFEIKVVAERVPESPEFSEWFTRMEAEADRDAPTSRVTLRWWAGEIATVKEAAAIAGVPYRQYMKQVVYRQALADIEQARAALGAPDKSPRPRTRKTG